MESFARVLACVVVLAAILAVAIDASHGNAKHHGGGGDGHDSNRNQRKHSRKDEAAKGAFGAFGAPTIATCGDRSCTTGCVNASVAGNPPPCVNQRQYRCTTPGSDDGANPPSCVTVNQFTAAACTGAAVPDTHVCNRCRPSQIVPGTFESFSCRRFTLNYNCTPGCRRCFAFLELETNDAADLTSFGRCFPTNLSEFPSWRVDVHKCNGIVTATNFRNDACMDESTTADLTAGAPEPQSLLDVQQALLPSVESFESGRCSDGVIMYCDAFAGGLGSDTSEHRKASRRFGKQEEHREVYGSFEERRRRYEEHIRQKRRERKSRM